ncbi:B3 domain-containing protein [Raphanus sativus]|nr:B3 domain-containing protein [Raphanus sativus]
MSCSSHTETRCLSKCESNKQDSHVFKEIVTAPLLEAEPESELLNPKPQTSNEETPASSSASASGARQGSAHVLNPEQYLFNPNNPYFVKTLTKKIDVLYVGHPVIEKYGLNFGPHKSPMYYIICNQKHDAFTKIYGRNPCFTGWAALCKKYNLKQGDSVICELERSGGVVTSVRIHFGDE